MWGTTRIAGWHRRPLFVGDDGCGAPGTTVVEEHSTGPRNLPRHPLRDDEADLYQGAGAYSSVKFRVTAGSTGMPGPVVVETTTFFR